MSRARRIKAQPRSQILDPFAHKEESGLALILTLLVLAIVLVITVQFTYSVRLEERVVANQETEETLGLAARGALWHLVAQMKADEAGELTVQEFELQEVDTKAEPFLDPEASDQRQLDTSGEGNSGATINIKYDVVDLERRFNLNWLLVENEKFKNHANAALKRLVVQLGHPEEFADALVDFVGGEVEGEEGNDPNDNSSTTPTGTGSQDENTVPPRRFLSLDELFTIEFEGVEQALTGKDEEGNEVEGIKPLLDFLTVWDTSGLNLNTAEPEIVASWFPNQDQKKPKPNKFSSQRRIKATKELITYRLHIEGEENFDTETTEDDDATAQPGTPDDEEDEEEEDLAGSQPTGEEGQSGSEWIGTAPLKSLRDVAKLPSLKFLFSSTAGQAPKQNQSGQPGSGGGAGAGDSEGPTNWYDVLTFKSRVYKLTITASGGSSTGESGEKIIEAIVFRGQTTKDPKTDTVVLQWRELSE